MSKVVWKPGSMLYPVPAVMVSCGDFETKKDLNIITIIYTGSVCRDPHQLFISVRPDRHSYGIIKKYGEFVVNLTNERLCKATDFCGVKSGRDLDKFKETGLTPVKANTVKAPLIEESPVNIECRLTDIVETGSHHMFLAEINCICADEKYMDKNGKFHFENTDPICYSHGKYFALGECLGSFGYSIKKNRS